MPKLYSSRQRINVLRKYGFEFISQKGSHLKYLGYISTQLGPNIKLEELKKLAKEIKKQN